METALLRIGTRDFLDKYDYRNQDTKEWKTLEALIGELRRLVGIYNESPGYSSTPRGDHRITSDR